TARHMDAVGAYQSEEGGQKGAARGAGALCHHAGKFSNLNEQKGRTERECEDREQQEECRLAPFGGQHSNPASVARQQQTHRLNENVAEVEQRARVWSARVITGKDRIGRKQSRKHDHVAEDENPESISDDDSLGSRAAPAAAAR